jgi:electron transfer flavoprotein beta subunit
MGLHIVACVKYTPTTVNVPVDSDGRPKTAGVAYAMNPFDEYAVEEALRLKERVVGSTVTALTLGPDAADAVLRDALSRGCDAGLLLAGPELEGGDSYTTSLALSAAIRKLGAEKPVHLVLFGKNTNDGNSGVVGGETAAWLGWPGVLGVKKIDAIDEESATVWRAMEDGVDVLKLRLPACLSTVKEINEPRLASLKGKMAAKKAVIPKWTAADLGLKPSELGAAGAKVAVLRSSPPPSRPAGLRIEGATAAEKARKLVDTLIERKLI